MQVLLRTQSMSTVVMHAAVLYDRFDQVAGCAYVYDAVRALNESRDGTKRRGGFY
jgi:hypothetical protein